MQKVLGSVPSGTTDKKYTLSLLAMYIYIYICICCITTLQSVKNGFTKVE